jgi:hypothetical protein
MGTVVISPRRPGPVVGGEILRSAPGPPHRVEAAAVAHRLGLDNG